MKVGDGRWAFLMMSLLPEMSVAAVRGLARVQSDPGISADPVAPLFPHSQPSSLVDSVTIVQNLIVR